MSTSHSPAVITKAVQLYSGQSSAAYTKTRVGRRLLQVKLSMVMSLDLEKHLHLYSLPWKSYVFIYSENENHTPAYIRNTKTIPVHILFSYWLFIHTWLKFKINTHTAYRDVQKIFGRCNFLLFKNVLH
jgi:hypothetical protein